jgi:starch synthase
MRLLHAASELLPYSKTGGLADMVDGLTKALAAQGHQVGVITPLYHGVREQFPDLQPLDYKLELPLGGGPIRASVCTRAPLPNLTIYFIDQPHFFDRPGLYQEQDRDYPDNAARFIFFSKCVAHLARHLPWQPEVVHLHDWQTGLVPLLVRHQRDCEGWRPAPATILTIHNLAFQGIFPATDYALTNLPPRYFQLEAVEYHRQMNCLKAGLVFSDFLTTVSPSYAREISSPELGCGLDGVLRRRQPALAGILNGVDYHEWKTAGNPHLRFSYTLRHIRGKTMEKRALQKELGLPEQDRVPLFGVVSRLSEQKGMDIELAALEEMLTEPMQFALLGSGDARFAAGFKDLAARFPEKVFVRIGYDHGLPHRITAGADFFLMPSRFEPCGLSQLYCLCYGTVPIVHATGGLDDSVTDITQDLAGADGIKFHEYSAPALAKAIRKALALYAHPALLHHYRRNGMTADFSWKRTSLEYVKVYGKARQAALGSP